MKNFIWAHEGEEVDIRVSIEWTKPVTHDVLKTGLVESDETAFFYIIIALINKKWVPFYIGKVYSQSVSERHKNTDHLRKIEGLTKDHPDVIWHIMLGTPSLLEGKITTDKVDYIEGLLIYSNWHEALINRSKINGFISNKHIHIINTGFTDPLHKEIGYGVFINS